MSNQLITSENERIKSLNGESFYIDEELSKKLKVSRRSLQDYRDEGRIPYIKLGGKILYRASDIEKLLEEGYREKFR
jgi:excisionase family DNA binding protein